MSPDLSFEAIVRERVAWLAQLECCGRGGDALSGESVNDGGGDNRMANGDETMGCESVGRSEEYWRTSWVVVEGW